MKKQLAERFKTNLIGRRFTKVNLFLVNPQTFVIKDYDRQLVDGGAEFHLDNGDVITFGWDSKYEMHNFGTTTFSKMFYSSDIVLLDTSDDYFWKQIIGKKIEDIELDWTYFEDLEYKRHYILKFIDFRLELDYRFLVCPMGVEIKNNEVKIIDYDPYGEIAVFFDMKEIENIRLKI